MYWKVPSALITSPEMTLPLGVEKTSALLSASLTVVILPEELLSSVRFNVNVDAIGASLTAVTEMYTTDVAQLTPSHACTVKLSFPEKFGFGLYETIPEVFTTDAIPWLA